MLWKFFIGYLIMPHILLQDRESVEVSMLPSRKLVAAIIAAQGPLTVEAADRLCTNDDGQVYALELELPFHHKPPFSPPHWSIGQQYRLTRDYGRDMVHIQ